MKSDVIIISNDGNQMETALNMADKVAAFNELSPKGSLHLRLLTEEMMGMMRSIAGKSEGEFWIESENGVHQLHLRVQARLGSEKREQMISASSSKTNEAAKGIMGKIRSFFEFSDYWEVPPFYPELAIGSPEEMHSEMIWSMAEYHEMLRQYLAENREGAKEAWDELEKSVVSNVADDIKVSIRGREVEMTIIKKLA